MSSTTGVQPRLLRCMRLSRIRFQLARILLYVSIPDFARHRQSGLFLYKLAVFTQHRIAVIASRLRHLRVSTLSLLIRFKIPGSKCFACPPNPDPVNVRTRILG